MFSFIAGVVCTLIYQKNSEQINQIGSGILDTICDALGIDTKSKDSKETDKDA